MNAAQLIKVAAYEIGKKAISELKDAENKKGRDENTPARQSKQT